jgi:MerR family transcriptional regulator, light-induced transcriptional regulator
VSQTPSRRAARADDAASPRYTVRVVAERLGLPTATLRSWNRRYGIGPTGHNPGSHRLYSEADIAVVEHMRQLIDSGASPGSAAETALDTVAPTAPDAQSLVAAAFRFDSVAVGRQLDQALRHFAVVDTWERLIRPAFADIEARQLGGERCIDVEHALSWAVMRSMQRLPIAADESSSIILACCQNETHTLALEALRAGLGERGRGALMLGADVPREALVDAIARRPANTKVVLWSQESATADVDTVAAVLEADAQLLVGGRGWASARLPKHVVRLGSLDSALRYLAA